MLAVGRPDREDPLGVLDRPAALGNGVQSCRDRSKGAVVTRLHECLEPVEQELDLAGRLPVGACLDQGVGCFSVIRHQFPAPAQQWQRAPVAEDDQPAEHCCAAGRLWRGNPHEVQQLAVARL